MVKIILMCTAVFLLDDIEGRKFGQDDVQKSTALQIFEADAGMRGEDDLVEFVLDALAAHNLDTVGHPFQCLIGLLFNLEIQLRGETYAAHHAQRVVRKSDLRVKGCGDDTVFEICQSVEGIDEFTEAVFVQTDGHRIDGEVATVLVIFQSTVLHDGLTRVMTVALLAGTDELHLVFHTFLTKLHLRCTEIPEDREVGLASEHLFQFFCHRDATADNHHVDIVGRPFQKDVPHVSAHDVALQA